MATRFARGKFGWQHSMAHLRKRPIEAKILQIFFYTDRVIINFVPNFVALATGVAKEKI